MGFYKGVYRGYMGLRASQDSVRLLGGVPIVRTIVCWGLYCGPLLRKAPIL